jgi:hypothetical protein
LAKIELKEALLVTYHTYDESGKHFLKETHWYRMRAGGVQDLVPQKEEQIEQLKWVSEKELAKYAKDSFPSIIDVLQQSGHL